MEVENGGLEDDFSLQEGHFPLNHDYGRKGKALWDLYKRQLPCWGFSVFTERSFYETCDAAESDKKVRSVVGDAADGFRGGFPTLAYLR